MSPPDLDMTPHKMSDVWIKTRCCSILVAKREPRVLIHTCLICLRMQLMCVSLVPGG